MPVGNSEAAVELIREAIRYGREESVRAAEAIAGFYSSAREEYDRQMELAEQSQAEGEQQLASIASAFDDLRELFGEVAKLTRSQEAVAHRGLTASQTLTKISSILQDSATESVILGVNTKIQAAQSGGGMQSIQVIADAIKTLATNVQRCSMSLEQAREGLDSSVPLMAKQSETLTSQTNEAEASMAALKSELEGGFRASQNRMSATLQEGLEKLEQHTLAVHQLMAHIQFQDRVSQLLGAALIQLEAEQDPSIGIPDSILGDNPKTSAGDIEEELMFLD